MLKIETVAEMQAYAKAQKSAGRRIGFVPTMGYLHDGHMHLIRTAAKATAVVVVSVFVNPLQFGPKEDFAAYPRDPEGDARKAQTAGAQVFFMPSALALYPPGFESQVMPGSTSNGLCGELRPGHFQGVATVVAKLFNIVLPDVAFFGRKDYQQLQVIDQMVRDLNFPVEIVGVETVRDEAGLALSSRNQYLSEPDRQRALIISKTLREVASLAARERLETRQIMENVREAFAKESRIEKIDYIEVVEPIGLKRLETVGNGQEGVLAVAVWFAGVRLIDNVFLGR